MALQSAEVVVVAVRGHEAEILAALAGFEVIGASSVEEALRLLMTVRGLPPRRVLPAEVTSDHLLAAEAV